MIRRFNEISNWVATSIVRAEKIRVRVKVMTKFLRLADVRFAGFFVSRKHACEATNDALENVFAKQLDGDACVHRFCAG
jgi:hypothetical protein